MPDDVATLSSLDALLDIASKGRAERKPRTSLPLDQDYSLLSATVANKVVVLTHPESQELAENLAKCHFLVGRWIAADPSRLESFVEYAEYQLGSQIIRMMESHEGLGSLNNIIYIAWMNHAFFRNRNQVSNISSCIRQERNVLRLAIDKKDRQRLVRPIRINIINILSLLSDLSLSRLPVKPLFRFRELGETSIKFLLKHYKDELDAAEVTLSDVRKVDQELWDALRKWGSRPGNDLDALIPRGRTTPGRPRKDEKLNLDALDPSIPGDAAQLELARRRAGQRARASRFRQRHAKPDPV